MSSFLEASGPAVEQGWAWFVAVATLVLLAVAWRVVGRLVRRHGEADRNARLKQLVALGAAVVLGVAGFLLVAGFEAKAREGTHRTFVTNLNQTVGESEYLENVKTVQSKPGAIATQSSKLAEANATLAAAPAGGEAHDKALKSRNDLWTALNTSREDLAKAQVKVKLLAPNHALWQKVAPLLAAHRDEEARHLLEQALDPATVAQVVPLPLSCERDPKTGECVSGNPAALTHTYRDTHTLQDVPLKQGVEDAYHHLARYNDEMTSQLRWFVYPNLSGLVLAPFVFAGGSILGRAFVASDTVGYKPYPGKAMGFFLLLGGFSVLAVPFAAWAVRDLAVRSKEGQISL